MRKFCSVLMVVALFLSLTGAARAEESISAKRTKIVVKSALFGFSGGLVVGLASQVFKRKTKNIFLFGSLGMYAGILLGIYVISTSSGPAPYEGPDTYDDYSSQAATSYGHFARAEKPASLRMNFLNVEF